MTGKIAVGVVTVLTVATSLFLGVVSLRDPEALVRGSALATAQWLTQLQWAHDLPLAVALLVLLALRAWRPLAWFLAYAGLIQVGDTIVFALQHDVVKTAGPAVYGVALFASAGWLAWCYQRRTA